MLLGSPPDMVHGAALHRACAHNQRPYFCIWHSGAAVPQADKNIITYFFKKIKRFQKEKRPMKKRRLYNYIWRETLTGVFYFL